MQNLKDKIYKGFFSNVGADPCTDWIDKLFASRRFRYAEEKDPQGRGLRRDTHRFRKSDNAGFLHTEKLNLRNGTVVPGKDFEIDLHKVPSILKINPNNLSVFSMERPSEVELLFCELMKIEDPKSIMPVYIYGNVTAVVIHKKTGAITAVSEIKELVM